MVRTVYTSDGDWLSGPQPVVNSAGQKFPSITAAAAATETATLSISGALRGTRNGRFRTAAGLQWAPLNAKPEIWPVALKRGRSLSKPPVIPTSLTEIEVPEMDLFSTGQIGKLVGCTSTPVRVAIREGKLAGSLTPGGHYRVRREALIAWLPTLGFCPKAQYVPDWVI